jgi:superfamily II DNA/RNA helicase
MSFDQFNLHSSISKAIKFCGYTKPTSIQTRSIPDIMEGKDVVASAQTGTGKTAAFVLPTLHKLSTTTPGRNPRVLILTPTRELSGQITDAIGRYGKFMNFNIVSLVGGMPYRQQLRALSRPLDIVVATPGRLLDHIENGKLKLSDIEMLVLDEADRMLDMGFIDDVMAIAKATSANRQTLLFSATVDNKLTQVVRHLLKNPIRIDMGHEKLTPAAITQTCYMTDSQHHKSRILSHILANENVYKAIVFSGTKINADRLADELRDQGYLTGALHGDLKQNVRNRTVEQLRRGKIQILVATDVAARGIDINDITHVINYDLPRFSEDYVHRIGRTGRAGKTGIAISFVARNEARCLQQIERFMNQKLTFSTIEGLEPTKGFQAASKSGGNGQNNRRRSGGGGYGGSNSNSSSNGGGRGRPASADARHKKKFYTKRKEDSRS